MKDIYCIQKAYATKEFEDLSFILSGRSPFKAQKKIDKG